MLPPTVLWVDPGKITGIACLADGQFSANELPFLPACETIEGICRCYGSKLAIGWERFTITRNTHKLTPQPDAMHVIGVCRYLSAAYLCRVLPEAQQATPSPLEQAQLRALGWWEAGQDDSQSAAAHMLRWLVACNELPPKEREILAGLGKGDR
jgi:hypothetical protein